MVSNGCYISTIMKRFLQHTRGLGDYADSDLHFCLKMFIEFFFIFIANFHFLNITGFRR